jgi:Flp pilus assembly protein protease CpaA
MPMSMYALFVLCLFVTVYDFRYRKVPNWITLPLMLIGFVISFPGVSALWLGSILMLSAWSSGWMGGGDVKLWVGLLWCTFSFFGEGVTLIMFISLIVTSIVQILARIFMKKREIVGIKLQGAWRALVFMMFLAVYSTGVLNDVRF